MPYYCKICKVTHPGWPHVENKKPQEYLDMSRIERKSCIELDESMIISHRNHDHHYLQAYWVQKIVDSEHKWYIKVWIMVDEETFYKAKTDKIKEFDAILQNPIMWYGPKSLFLPLKVKVKKNRLVITDIRIKGLPNREYKEGLNRKLADEWAESIIENCDMQCFNNPNERF